MANATRDNFERAQFVGYDPGMVRFYQFALSGFFAGIGGGLYCMVYEIITFDTVGAVKSSTALLSTYIGGAGHFFGERAILKEKRRSATIRSTTRAKLLVLDAVDFKALIAQEAAIAQHVHKVAHERMALNVEAEDGDLTSEEVASGDVV